VNAQLARTLAAASQRGDLVVALIVVVAVVMMIIPLPTILVDVVIAANIAVSFLVLLICLYASGPAQFSSLPAIILIATLFRLAISITTSRLVLLQADAGELVSAFGAFVVGNNIGVGLVVFLIITVAQFVVITKGGERVAEVAARFSLDAMPGRQMSIDSDLRNGDIDQTEARRQRRALQVESQFYGAMDGTMKFVKGDAIAALIVIVVNLCGGLAIGTLQHGMPLAAAAETYAILTVGDGLVAQIPALLVSVAAGTAVTRVIGEGPRDLGSEIVEQVAGQPRAMAIAAAIAATLALVPGFPTLVFAVLAAAFAGGSALAHRRAAALSRGAEAEMEVEARSGAAEPVAPAEDSAATAAPAAPDSAAIRDGIVVRAGRELARAVPLDAFRASADRARHDLAADLGVEARAIGLCVDDGIAADAFRIDFEGIPVMEGTIPGDCLLVDDDATHLDLLGIHFETTPPFPPRPRPLWVAAQHEEMLANAGIAFARPPQALAECLADTLRRNATQFIGVQETRRLIAGIEADYGDLVRELQKTTPLPKIAEILRRLVQEEVPIRNLRLILETLIEWGQREQDVVMLVEYVRTCMRREICFRFADANRVISAYLLDRAVEETVRSSLHKTNVGTFLTLADGTTQAIIAQLKGALAGVDAKAKPVMLTSMDIRRHVRNLLTTNDITIPVLSFQDIASEFNVVPLATITLGPSAEGPQAEAPEHADGDGRPGQP
jgi:type III secretion protein V